MRRAFFFALGSLLGKEDSPPRSKDPVDPDGSQRYTSSPVRVCSKSWVLLCCVVQDGRKLSGSVDREIEQSYTPEE